MEMSLHKRLFRPSVTIAFDKDHSNKTGSLPVFLQLNPEVREMIEEKEEL